MILLACVYTDFGCVLRVLPKAKHAKHKKKVIGDTPNPGKGLRPLHSRFTSYLWPGSMLTPGFYSGLIVFGF